MTKCNDPDPGDRQEPFDSSEPRGEKDQGWHEARRRRRQRLKEFRDGMRRDRDEIRRQFRASRSRRKGRVLHTRISDELADDIRRLAEDLRVPTSNLVRNVLEEVFAVAESVSDDLGNVVDDVVEEAEAARDRLRDRLERRRARTERREAEGASPQEPKAGRGSSSQPHFAEVLGWQSLVLNQSRACADCGDEISAGATAHVGVGESGFCNVTLCQACLDAR